MAKKHNTNPEPTDKFDPDFEEFTEPEELDLKHIEDDVQAEETKAPVESAQESLEDRIPVLKINTYLVQPGDSYASLAASLYPKGTKKHHFAIALSALNGNRPLKPGMTIKLPQ